jgi:hypothetical protein
LREDGIAFSALSGKFCLRRGQRGR